MFPALVNFDGDAPAELTLRQMLDDPITQLVMRADRVTRKQVEQLFAMRTARKEAA